MEISALNKNKSNINLRIISFIIGIYCFFSYIMNGYYMLTIIFGFLTLSVIFYKKDSFVILKDNLLWFLFGFINLISLFYTNNYSDGIKLVISVFIIIFIKMAIENEFEFDFSKLFINMFFFFSLIHVVATLLYFIFPDLIIFFNSILLNSEQLALNMDQYELGGSAGITGQTGTTSFYISIFNSIVFGKIISSKKGRLINLILLSIGLIALFTTLKRGPLLFNVIIIFIIFFIMGVVDRKKFIRYITQIVVLSILFFIIITFLSDTNPMIYKWVNTDDISNGRFELYKTTWQYFTESPIVGHGVQSTKILLNGGAPHNIYLQVLAELGLIGFICIILLFIITFLKSIILIKKTLKSNRNNGSLSILTTSFYVQLYFVFYGFTGNPLFDINFLLIYVLFSTLINLHLISDKGVKNYENRNINIS